MKPSDTTQKLHLAILKVIEKQIRDNDPAETQQTLQRLVSQGFSREEALELVGHVVASEVLGVIKDGRTYDHHRFVAALMALPERSG